MIKSDNYISSLIARRIVSTVLVLFLFTSSMQTNNVFITPTDAWMTGTSYSLLISSMPETKGGVSIMENILRRNTIRPKKSIIKKYYDGSRTIGAGGISQGTWDSWIKKAYSGNRENDICYFYYDGHTVVNKVKGVKVKKGYPLHKNSKVEKERTKKKSTYCTYVHLLETIKNNTKGKVVLILDTCFAAEILEHIKVLGKAKERFIIIAGVEKEQTEKSPLIENPLGDSAHLFTSKLKKGCTKSKGKWAIDSDGNFEVSLNELQTYTRKLQFGRKPVFYGDSGTIIFEYIGTQLKLNRKETLLGINKSITLKANVEGKKGTVKWSSSNSSVATVTSKGKVTGRKRGTATITASLNGAKVTCKVKVTIPVSKVTLNKTTASLTKGKTITLKATVSPSNAVKKTIKWTSSNSKVATVSSKGVVKGISKGTATITVQATDGSGKKATCKITVKNNASSSSITDFSKVLNKKPAAAAKAIGFTKITKQTYITYCTKPGKKYGPGYTYFWYYNECKNWEGGWNIIVVDNTISLYGVKKGAKISTLHSKLINKGWIKLHGSGTSGDTFWNYSRKGREYSESLNIYHYNGIIYKFEFEGALLD